MFMLLGAAFAGQVLIPEATIRFFEPGTRITAQSCDTCLLRNPVPLGYGLQLRLGELTLHGRHTVMLNVPDPMPQIFEGKLLTEVPTDDSTIVAFAGVRHIRATLLDDGERADGFAVTFGMLQPIETDGPLRSAYVSLELLDYLRPAWRTDESKGKYGVILRSVAIPHPRIHAGIYLALDPALGGAIAAEITTFGLLDPDD